MAYGYDVIGCIQSNILNLDNALELRRIERAKLYVLNQFIPAQVAVWMSTGIGTGRCVDRYPRRCGTFTRRRRMAS